MAELSTTDRQRIWRVLMRYWSNIREVTALSKSDLQAAVNATDTWINDNQTSYNSALPQAAQDNLTAGQKTLLLCATVLMRYEPDVAALLQRALGAEVN